MYPFVKPGYNSLSVDQRKELCSYSYRICAAMEPWSPKAKDTILELLDKVMVLGKFLKNDLESLRSEIAETNPLERKPTSVLQSIRCYLIQFYVIKDKKLHLPTSESKPEIIQNTQIQSQTKESSVGKLRAIKEEVWWVVRVKNDYRMCRLTFDRGEYWEMVEYVGLKVHNPKYKFPKYDNRVIYEFKEHITPDMFADKIQEAVEIRKAALLKQAEILQDTYATVLIARHPTGGTLVGGVIKEDIDNWYLDAYNEQGERILLGDTCWKLEKKSRCTVLQIIRRK